ncbi:hypothetical protein HRG_013695 [Hirsutella rhossiliensis]
MKLYELVEKFPHEDLDAIFSALDRARLERKRGKPRRKDTWTPIDCEKAEQVLLRDASPERYDLTYKTLRVLQNIGLVKTMTVNVDTAGWDGEPHPNDTAIIVLVLNIDNQKALTVINRDRSFATIYGSGSVANYDIAGTDGQRGQISDEIYPANLLDHFEELGQGIFKVARPDLPAFSCQSRIERRDTKALLPLQSENTWAIAIISSGHAAVITSASTESMRKRS